MFASDYTIIKKLVLVIPSTIYGIWAATEQSEEVSLRDVFLQEKHTLCPVGKYLYNDCGKNFIKSLLIAITSFI